MSSVSHDRTRADLAAAAAGFVFAIGLGFAGMTRPSKVAAFLDVTGAWDPSLAFVMVGAIGVHALAWRFRWASPRFAPSYAVPEKKAVDARLIAGAALFGLGWGAAGFCPGPAVVSVGTCAPTVLAFVAAMVAGIAASSLVTRDAPRTEVSAATAQPIDG